MTAVLRVGSTDATTGGLVSKWQRKLLGNFPGYSREVAAPYTGKPLVVDGTFGYPDRDWQKVYQAHTGQTPDGVVTDADLKALGLSGGAIVTPPPPKPRKRHLAVVYRGTGGVIGQDYVSRVCQGAGDLVREENPDFPATMGGIPVGATQDGINGVSMAKAVDIGEESGSRLIERELAADPELGIVVGGYSAGAVAAARIRASLLTPGARLNRYGKNYVCSFSLGDPTRPFGGSWYMGPRLAGQGISSWRFGDVNDARHCWLTHPDDMYGNIPLGVTGDIMDDAYDLVTKVQMSDPLGTIQAMIPQIPVVAQKAGISLPGMFGALAGGPAGLIGFALPLMIGMLPGLISAGGGNTAALTGPAAAAQAAIIGLKFMAAGTGPHITYERNEVWPGQTYLGLGIQHVRDWSSRWTYPKGN